MSYLVCETGVLCRKKIVYLRNKFNFWSVHGIMNTSGRLQNKSSQKGFALTMQVTRCVHDSMTGQKLNLLLIFALNYKYLIFKYYSKQFCI